MKKQLLLAAVAGLTLVSAHPPQADRGPQPREARSGYPPCSRTVTDRCIQLYERGVNAPANLGTALPPHPEDEDIDVAYAGDHLQAGRPHPPAPAAAPPIAPPPRVQLAAAPRHYPPCTAAVRDRCTQQRTHHPQRVAAYRPTRRLAMRIRRAGERG